MDFNFYESYQDFIDATSRLYIQQMLSEIEGYKVAVRVELLNKPRQLINMTNGRFMAIFSENTGSVLR